MEYHPCFYCKNKKPVLQLFKGITNKDLFDNAHKNTLIQYYSIFYYAHKLATPVCICTVLVPGLVCFLVYTHSI